MGSKPGILTREPVFFLFAGLMMLTAFAACLRCDARFGYNGYSEIGRIEEKLAREEIASLKLRGVKTGDVLMLPALRKLSCALGQQDKFDEQEQALKQIVALDLRFPAASSSIEKVDALKVLGDLRRRSSPGESEQLFERALKIASTVNRKDGLERTVELHSWLASIANKRRDLLKTENHYRSIDIISGGIENQNYWPDSLLDGYGKVLLELKEYDRAIITFQRLMALDRKRPSKYDERILGDMVSLAGCYSVSGRKQQFQSVADSILQLADRQCSSRRYLRDSWKDALIALGGLLEKNRQFSRAERAYRLCLIGD